MKTTMTIMSMVLGVYGAATGAHAAPANAVPDPQSLAPECRPLAAAPVDSQIDRPLYAAKTSTADCQAIVALHEAGVPPTDASVKSLTAGLEPSLFLLDDAIANGDLESQIVAMRAKADLLVGVDVRVAGSVAQVGNMTGSDLAEYRRQIDQAHGLTSSWRDRGIETYRDLDRLVHTPAGQDLAARNTVIMSIARELTSAPAR